MKRLTCVIFCSMWLVGCGANKAAESGDKAAKGSEKGAEDTKSDDSPKMVVDAEGGASETPDPSQAPLGAREHIDAEPAGPLTEAEKALIAADPKDLNKEDRRKRSFALRKKIMQNPDSEGAQSILQGAAAIERGEMQVPTNLVNEPTVAPEGAAPEK